MTTPAPPTPLQEIERAARVRADAAALDMNDPDAAERLRAIIAEEVARWNDDQRRGRHSHRFPDEHAIVTRAFRNLAGFGPLEPLLDDPDVWEIMVNAPDAVFVRRHRAPSGYHEESFHDDDHVARTLNRLLDAAGTHRKLDPAEGLQDAQLASGARVHVVHRDLTAGAHLVVNIRKFTGVAVRSLDELVALGTLDAASAAVLRAAVRGRRSIVFSGAPGSGKTTLLSCCAAELDPSLRVVTAEEVLEIDIPVANVASLQTRAARSDREAVDLRRLVAGFLRMSPDIAIVGEVRDREALPLLLTLSSGVTGYTTIHAASARQALTRLRFVAQLADGGASLPAHPLTTLVSETVDLVVHCRRGPSGPVVEEIVAVEDLLTTGEAAPFTVTELFHRPTPETGLRWTGTLPIRLCRRLERHDVDLRTMLQNLPERED
ncbi:MAG: CpaF family protein [Actinobacteria bacterium]|nr:CpaF family protein [Actinomycetota bacterium]